MKAPDKAKLENEQANLNSQISTLNNEIKDLNKDLELLKKSPKPSLSPNRPYKLETFSIKDRIEPFRTKLCTNFGEYTQSFGPFSADEEDEPGVAKDPNHRALTHAVYGFFQNGGTRCFVCRIKNVADFKKGLEQFESIDAIAIVVAPGFTGDRWEDVVSHCKTCEDRFAILDCPQVVGSETELDIKLLNYDSPNKVLPKTNKNAAYYFPWITVSDPAKQLQDQDPARNIPLKYRGRLQVPPSGHVAGIYARTDEERGVHKAPANAAIIGALNVKYYIGRPKHELLNPQGVNVIRNINGNIYVWGARTIGGDKNMEWKYLSVRRLFLFLKESIDEGTQWVVFEPNDTMLWGKINRNVRAFLTNVWRSGALFGSTPDEAFYVKCDAETNPPEVRELGQVITEIGVAIVRPAEFVIFRISQSGSLQGR
ncbi:MAG: phage tail sheath family protein [Desulfobulbaceae bacterium]|nr:phage tail sheath family protein [Desulfobulbaceae bacterium]